MFEKEEEKFPLKIEEEKVEKKEKKFKHSESGDIELVFKQNRSFELHIGRSIYRFAGRQAVRVPRSVLTHSDFTAEVKKYFVIKEH